MALAVSRGMDVTMGEARWPASSAQSRWASPTRQQAQQQASPVATLQANAASPAPDFPVGDNKPAARRHLLQQERPMRADTPCPAALRTDANRRKAGGVSYVLMPDGKRRFIELEAGTTVVGRCKSTGIRDHHVSRRHVEVTVPEEGADGSREGCCRIKYIGRNCRVVLVGGILLKAEQEVAAGPGTRVILNFNNKGLPLYCYTLVPAKNLPALAGTLTSDRRVSGVGMAVGAPDLWRASGLTRPTLLLGGGRRQHEQNQARQHNHNSTAIKHKQRPGRFRKEAQEKLKQERDEIFSRFADLKFV